MSKILAVDNDPFILEFLRDILTSEGHEVLTAVDGLNAVDVLDAYTPDIIFVDLVMPNIDGKRLCKIIRAMRNLENVYLVVLSATLDKEYQNLESLSVDQCIAKGTLEEMTRNVLSAVHHRKTLSDFVSPTDRPLHGEPLAPKTLTEELFSIKKHFEVIFERMSEGILEISSDRRVVYANPAALSVIGLSEEKLLASPVADIFPKEYVRMVLKLIAALTASPGQKVEDTLIAMKGYQLMVNALAVNNGGKSSILILNDVTLQKEAEAALKRRNLELELLNRQREKARAELDESLQTLRRTLNGTIQAIALITEIKDPYTAGHQRRVSALAKAIGEKLGLSKDRIETFRIAGLIHDIGKMATPTAILSKPGALNKYEFSLIEEHAGVGYEILNKVTFPCPVAEIVYQHHERMDGSGYPRGLSGSEILMEARILGVADVVEAMASHRPYRAARGIPAALEEINQLKGALYDSDVVMACVEIFQSGDFHFGPNL